MAQWKMKGSGGSLQGVVDYTGVESGDSVFKIYQDEKPFLEQAKLDRELKTNSNTGYKKFATIPDIVAIEINEKHGIDIHSPDILHDREKMARFKRIVKEDYKHLLSF